LHSPPPLFWGECDGTGLPGQAAKRRSAHPPNPEAGKKWLQEETLGLTSPPKIPSGNLT